MSKIKGIDVSGVQQKIDWKKVKADGVEFAIIKAGYGNSATQMDSRFIENVKGAAAAGIHIGAYWFSYATSVEDAKKEAAACHEILKPYKDKITYPVFFDYEYDSARYSEEMGVKPTSQLVTDMAVAFMEAMKGYGYLTGFYTNLDYIDNKKLDYSRLKSYDLWLAHYTDGEPKYSCALQQTSSSGKVNGIAGNVDTDVAFKEYGKKEETPSRPSQAKPSVTCTGNSVRVRAEAHTAGKVLGFVNKGDNLALLADDGWGWSKIKANGVTGWMVNEYIQGASRSGYKTGKCNGSYVNVRAAANLNGNILTQMNKGDTFTLVCILPSNWLHVRFKGVEGYVFYDKSYIAL